MVIVIDLIEDCWMWGLWLKKLLNAGVKWDAYVECGDFYGAKWLKRNVFMLCLL